MKRLTAVVFVLAVSLFLWTSRAELAPIEPVGKVSLEAGAEKEEGNPAGARGTFSILGVMPLAQSFGLQGSAHYVGGLGSRFGVSAGPIFGWEAGKAGLFVAYQYRTPYNNNFVHLRPSVALYLSQANINLFYSHPISSPQRDDNQVLCPPRRIPGCEIKRVEYGTNQLAATFNYFIGSDLASFLRKDNVELTLGVQGNSFGGAGSDNLTSGVGPVFGVAVMPTRGLELNLVKGAIDHHGRYRVQAGVSYYFDKAAATLKALRRRYLEPNNFSPNGAGGNDRFNSPRCLQCTE